MMIGACPSSSWGMSRDPRVDLAPGGETLASRMGYPWEYAEGIDMELQDFTVRGLNFQRILPVHQAEWVAFTMVVNQSNKFCTSITKTMIQWSWETYYNQWKGTLNTAHFPQAKSSSTWSTEGLQLRGASAIQSFGLPSAGSFQRCRYLEAPTANRKPPQTWGHYMCCWTLFQISRKARF